MKVAELVRLFRDRGGDNSHTAIVRYHPGFKEAYGLIHMSGTGPVLFTIFGDDSFNRRRLRRAWKDWEKDSTLPQPEEWSFKWAVGSFVRWLNSGGERRLVRARDARRAARAGA